MNYKKHFVCFIDILGFKNMIIRSKTDEKELNKILDVLTMFKQLKDNFAKQEAVRFGVFDEKNNAISPIQTINNYSQMSLFSDSIIITYECKELTRDMINLYLILHDISFLAFQLLELGIFTRGGLAYGDLYHKDDICFGPALVEAVALEKEALYPRIAISNCIVDKKSNDFPYKGIELISKNYKFITEEMISKDLTEDNQTLFLDYLYLYMNEQNAEPIKQIILNQLSKEYDDYIMSKYIWFALFFNETLNSIPLGNVGYINDKRIASRFHKQNPCRGCGSGKG